MINWEAASAIANSVMAIASIFGLGFIYKQLVTLSSQEEQQNRELKLSHYSEYTSRYQDILLNFPSNIGALSFQLHKLKAADREKILVYMRAYFDLCYEEWDLHNRQLIDQKDWDVWKDGMSKTLVRPAFRESWQHFTSENSEFGDTFTKFVSDLHANEDKK
jgi:hypothetical protein